MRNHGKIKLGFYPLPVTEAMRLKNYLVCREQFSAVDPCIGDGVAFAKLLEGVVVHRYGIEIDAHRAEQAKALGIQTLQANALDVRCPAEGISLLYLNPPYDFEAGSNGNQRLEKVFLEHTYRWLRPEGVLVFVIPQPQLQPCARLLAEHFTNLRIYRLTDPSCLQYKQIAVLALRRKRNERTGDAALLDAARYVEGLAVKGDLAPLTGEPDGRYDVPDSQPIILNNTGVPLDEVEDLLLGSAAYRQASRILLREQGSVRG